MLPFSPSIPYHLIRVIEITSLYQGWYIDCLCERERDARINGRSNQYSVCGNSEDLRTVDVDQVCGCYENKAVMNLRVTERFV
jgi:hypothetical protein